MRLDATKGLPENLDANYIFHCASIASPIFYRKYPIETIDANITGLRLLLDYALQNPQKVKSILYFSSSEIYGDPSPDQIPTSEEYCGNVSCVGPRACYDESKRLCETLCYSYYRQHNVPVKIVRPFNNFGPGLFPDDGRVLADFANAVISGKPITLLSSGKPSRTFCYIADAITGYYKALVRGRPAEAYNIGTETPEISMRELAEMFVSIATKEFGYNGKIEFSVSEDKDYLTHNPNRRSPKIDKARRELGYEPQIALRQGISNYIRWAKETH
jgi:UDP-glucuronate decarboxylase